MKCPNGTQVGAMSNISRVRGSHPEAQIRNDYGAHPSRDRRKRRSTRAFTTDVACSRHATPNTSNSGSDGAAYEMSLNPCAGRASSRLDGTHEPMVGGQSPLQRKRRSSLIPRSLRPPRPAGMKKAECSRDVDGPDQPEGQSRDRHSVAPQSQAESSRTATLDRNLPV